MKLSHGHFFTSFHNRSLSVARCFATEARSTSLKKDHTKMTCDDPVEAAVRKEPVSGTHVAVVQVLSLFICQRSELN